MAFPKRQYMPTTAKNIAFFTVSCSMVFCSLFLHVIGRKSECHLQSKNIPDATLLFILCSPLNAVSNTINPSALSTGLCVCTQLYFCFKKFLCFCSQSHLLCSIYCMTYIVFVNANYHLNHTVNLGLVSIKYKNQY